MQPGGDNRRAPAHRLDRGAAVARLAERREIGSGRSGDLVLRDVGLDQRLEHAGVDEHDVHAVLAQAVAQVVVLLPLRVERAEQDDGRHGGDPTAAAPGRQAGLESMPSPEVRRTTLPFSSTAIAPSSENESRPSGAQAGWIASVASETTRFGSPPAPGIV